MCARLLILAWRDFCHAQPHQLWTKRRLCLSKPCLCVAAACVQRFFLDRLIQHAASRGCELTLTISPAMAYVPTLLRSKDVSLSQKLSPALRIGAWEEYSIYKGSSSRDRQLSSSLRSSRLCPFLSTCGAGKGENQNEVEISDHKRDPDFASRHLTRIDADRTANSALQYRGLVDRSVEVHINHP